jgi:hypothetical protein
MPASDRMHWDGILTAMEDDLVAASDADVLAEATHGEVDALRGLIATRIASTRSNAPARRPVSRLPADPAERRSLLRLMLKRPAARRLAVGFSEARELPDQDVEKLLRLLLASDRSTDPD